MNGLWYVLQPKFQFIFWSNITNDKEKNKIENHTISIDRFGQGADQCIQGAYDGHSDYFLVFFFFFSSIRSLFLHLNKEIFFLMLFPAHWIKNSKFWNAQFGQLSKHFLLNVALRANIYEYTMTFNLNHANYNDVVKDNIILNR